MIPSRQPVRVDEGKGWSFTDGAFEDAPERGLRIPEAARRRDGAGMQGHHYGFLKDRAYGDLSARFSFRLGSHSDVGLLFHAASPSDFFVLHFPECGQANRAQHFWAALSRMDDGWLRIVRLDLLRRVSSTGALWHEADVRLSGDRLRAVIDGRGVFEISSPALRGVGRCGVYLFTSGEVRDLFIEGAAQTAPSWDAENRPPQRWFFPSPDTSFGAWQRPGQIVRTEGNELLHSFTVQERPYSGAVTSVLSRSRDNGRTWTKPQPVARLKAEAWDGWGTIHRCPDGTVRMFSSHEDSLQRAVTHDGGRSWSEPETLGLPLSMPGVDRLHLPPAPFVNRADGSLLMFAYGRHDSTIPESSIFSWGAWHCQSFVSRSADNGATWSAWKNLDGTLGAEQKTIEGNMDLTETCGVETRDGRIVALTRPIYSPWMWESWSDDGGLTWTPCLRGPFPGYATPNMLRTASGAILVAHRLPGCTIHASFDDGRSWDGGTMIDSAIWCMGSMIEVEPDRVLYVYWDSFESLMRAQYVRVTSRGLEPG